MSRRQVLLGMAGLGAAVVASGPAAAQSAADEYTERVRPIAALGLGKEQGASLSVVWFPRTNPNEQLPPRVVELVIFDLAGNRVASKMAQLAPFTGASVDYAHRKGDRQSVFSYVFVDEPFDDIFAGFEIYDLKSGQTILAIPGVLP